MAEAWKHGESGEPEFPDDFEIVKKAVLQVTDLKTNRNKYYAIELHRGGAKFRVFTHYGRTDDLETNPNSGQKECRYFDNQVEADSNYLSIYREKTSPRKGYKELALASSKIGSQKARGASVGEVDSKTLDKLAKAKEAAGEPVPAVKSLGLDSSIQSLVRYLFSEATNALTSSVSAKITANGIETPLGVLTIGQIEKGEAILLELYDLFKSNKQQASKMEDLSGEFYTVIPHRIGRTRSAIAGAVINTMDAFQQKQETLQLMKDMLQVNGEAGNVLYNEQIDAQYLSLKCDIAPVPKSSGIYHEIEDHIIKSQIKSKNIKVKNLFTVRRGGEWEKFDDKIGNQRLLFHGSRIQNWVGLLSRGILLPKIVVSMGVNRTDAGWLGNGIYFGDAACTSAFYTSAGKSGTRFLTVARVSLGKIKQYHKITYGLEAPPPGYDSCHGVRSKLLSKSEFADDEYVVYSTDRQRMEYLAEFSC